MSIARSAGMVRQADHEESQPGLILSLSRDEAVEPDLCG
jgi:hypothetical protein